MNAAERELTFEIEAAWAKYGASLEATDYDEFCELLSTLIFAAHDQDPHDTAAAIVLHNRTLVAG